MSPASTFAPWLLQASLSAAVFGLLVLLLHRLKSPLPPRLLYLLGLLVFLRLLLPPLPLLEAPLRPGEPSPSAAAAASPISAPSPPLAPVSFEQPPPSGPTGAEANSLTRIASSTPPAPRPPAPFNPAPIEAEASSPPDKAGRFAAVERAWSRLDSAASATLNSPWIWLAWALGALIWLLLLSRQQGQIRAITRRGHEVNSPAVLTELATEADRLELRRRPLLIESALAPTPFVHGLIRPRLVVPEGLLERFSAQERRAVFHHELLHLCRGDLWINHGLALLECIHWFNPILARVRRRLLLEREILHDSSCAQAFGAAPYARALLRVSEEFGRNPGFRLGVTMTPTEHTMKTRIQHLVSPAGPSRSNKLLGLAATTLIAGSTLTWAQQEARPTPPEAAPVERDETPEAPVAPDRDLRQLALHEEIELPENEHGWTTLQFIPAPNQVVGEPVEVIAFVRSGAGYVGLDPTVIAEEFGIVPPPLGLTEEVEAPLPPQVDHTLIVRPGSDGQLRVIDPAPQDLSRDELVEWQALEAPLEADEGARVLVMNEQVIERMGPDALESVVTQMQELSPEDAARVAEELGLNPEVLEAGTRVILSRDGVILCGDLEDPARVLGDELLEEDLVTGRVSEGGLVGELMLRPAEPEAAAEAAQLAEARRAMLVRRLEQELAARDLTIEPLAEEGLVGGAVIRSGEQNAPIQPDPQADERRAIAEAQLARSLQQYEAVQAEVEQARRALQALEAQEADEQILRALEARQAEEQLRREPLAEEGLVGGAVIRSGEQNAPIQPDPRADERSAMAEALLARSLQQYEAAQAETEQARRALQALEAQEADEQILRALEARQAEEQPRRELEARGLR